MVDKVKSQHSASQNGPECRIAYPFFHKRREKNAKGLPLKGGPRFDATFMFPKIAADAASCPNYAFLWALAVEAAKKMWPASVDAAGNWVWPQGALYPVKDGDQPLTPKFVPGQTPLTPEQLAQKYAWRKGYWIFEASHMLDPGPKIAKIVNGQLMELPAQTVNGVQMYKSGDWGIPNIHAYAYQNEQFGVNFGFDGFCFTKEGEAIGSSGQRSASQMFGGLAPGGVVAAPVAAPPPMPGAPVAPQAAMAPAAAPQPQAYAPPGPPVAAPQAYAPPMPAAPVAAPPMQPAAAPVAAPPPMPGAPVGAPPLPPMPTR